MSDRPYDEYEEAYAYAGPEVFGPGGGTRAGLTMQEQGDIAEDIVQAMGSIPGYGPIIWWADDYNSPLDGATNEWGIEVKSANFDNTRHRWMVYKKKEVADKHEMALAKGHKGILGILVVLDFSSSTADVYAKALPFYEETDDLGNPYQTAIKTFSKSKAEVIAEGLPFKNPFMDPDHGAPSIKTDAPF